MHADVLIDVVHFFPPVTSGSGTSRSPPYGPAPATTIGRPVRWPSSITVA